MRGILYDILIEPFTDFYWLKWLFGIIMWVLFLFLSGVILLLTIWLADSTCLPEKSGNGVITNKYIVPAHTTTTFIHIGKSIIPQIHHHPTSYDIEITIDGIKDEVSLYQSEWNELELNQIVFCHYTNGRILKSLYIQSFKP